MEFEIFAKWYWGIRASNISWCVCFYYASDTFLSAFQLAAMSTKCTWIMPFKITDRDTIITTWRKWNISCFCNDKIKTRRRLCRSKHSQFCVVWPCYLREMNHFLIFCYDKMSRQVDTCVTQNILKGVKFWYGLNFDLKESNWASNISESVCFQYVSDTFHACFSDSHAYKVCLFAFQNHQSWHNHYYLMEMEKNIFLL